TTRARAAAGARAPRRRARSAAPCREARRAPAQLRSRPRGGARAYDRHVARFLVLGVFVTAAVTIFALIDLMRIDEARVRALPRAAWVAAIVLLPLIGAILWFT